MSIAQVVAVAELALDVMHLTDPERLVSWVATSELTDPTPYLQGGELLLTTGLETARWGDEWDAYVARLVSADVAALGLGVGLTLDGVPDPLLRACRQHGLNLVAVPRPTAFVQVSRSVAGLLDTEAEHAARQALEAQRLLTRAALRGDDAAVLRQLAKVVGGRAAIVDAAGADAALAVRDGSTVVQPLGLAARPTGWLAVTTPLPLVDADRSTVSTAVALLTLSSERRREQRSHGRTLRARALGLLLGGDAESAVVLLDAAGTGLPTAPVRVLVLRADQPDVVLDLLDEDGVAAGLIDGEVVAVCSARRGARIAAELAERGAFVGIGTAGPLTETPRSRDTAIHALGRTTAAAPVHSWDDLHGTGIAGLLGAAAASYAAEWLAPLAGRDELLETLSSYLAHHGSVGDTASALGVHRNTVRNRVTAIEDLLDRSLDDPTNRAEAWIALSVPAPGGGW